MTLIIIIIIKDIEFLEKSNEIWEKVSNMIKKKFNSERIYNKKYLKAEKNVLTKISTQNNALNIYIYIYIYILVILIDSVYIKDKNYYPQVLSEKI